jgi:hypothetical protein
VNCCRRWEREKCEACCHGCRNSEDSCLRDVVNILDTPRHRVCVRASDDESLNTMILAMRELAMQGVRIAARSPRIRCPPLSGGLVRKRKSAVCCQGWEAKFTEARVQSWRSVKVLCFRSRPAWCPARRLKQDAHGRCANIRSSIQTPPCVQLSRGTGARILKQTGPEHEWN